jgi:hypothetical protein
MIATILRRVAYCSVGYLWAAFVAAIAITLLRAAQDLTSNAIDFAELPFYVVALASIMTLANILNGFIPALIVIAALEAILVIHRLPAIWSLYMIAGAGCGYYLASQSIGISTLETVFHVASWTLGGLAFWHMSVDRRRVPKES